ncbi:MAG: fluoride efflux transporter CrcB [Rhodospirillaceae bacterium]|nr:fluoride efflux transporter CrcB [Rhodospirillaceae bacterium]MBL6930548.1 fluoride efflux transporter CrcB [Rhodospirillales bacterium]
MSFKMLTSIAFGGAFGAVFRYLMMSGIGHFLHAGFPYATLAVNVLGSFVLGSLIEIMAISWSPGQEMRSFLVVGVLGAFTTFSAFSMDVVFLIERGQLTSAGGYIALSVILSVAGVFAGMMMFRQILT